MVKDVPSSLSPRRCRPLASGHFFRRAACRRAALFFCASPASRGQARCARVPALRFPLARGSEPGGARLARCWRRAVVGRARAGRRGGGGDASSGSFIAKPASGRPNLP